MAMLPKYSSQERRVPPSEHLPQMAWTFFRKGFAAAIDTLGALGGASSTRAFFAPSAASSTTSPWLSCSARFAPASDDDMRSRRAQTLARELLAFLKEFLWQADLAMPLPFDGRAGRRW